MRSALSGMLGVPVVVMACALAQPALGAAIRMTAATASTVSDAAYGPGPRVAVLTGPL